MGWREDVVQPAGWMVELCLWARWKEEVVLDELMVGGH